MSDPVEPSKVDLNPGEDKSRPSLNKSFKSVKEVDRGDGDAGLGILFLLELIVPVILFGIAYIIL